MNKERTLFEAQLTENTLYYCLKHAIEQGEPKIAFNREETLDLYLLIKDLRKLADPETWQAETSKLYYWEGGEEDAESTCD